MTVFMTPRNNYEFGRHDSHRNMAWVTLLMVLLIGGGIYVKAVENRWNSLFALPVVPALLCSNGRRTMRRGFTEVFYGTLYTFTGVISKGGHYTES